MKILVINAGSSSLKYQLIDIETEKRLLKGICDRIGMNGGTLTQENAEGGTLTVERDMKTHKEAIELVLGALTDKQAGAISSVAEIGAVGHRVLHSGEDFDRSVIIDDEVVRICEKNAELGPLHMPGNIGCIKSCREVMPGVPMVAVFDTTFHSTMPPKAFMYGIPYSVYEKYKVRKYGFHGTSHKFVSEEAIKFLGAENCRRLIVCHLGMSGKLKTTDEPPAAPDKHDHLIIQTSAGCLVYNDPRRFGLFFAAPTTELEKLPCFSKLGKDPFAADFDGEYLFSGCRRRDKAVKPVLLDQSFVAGIGNIYASEILFDAGIRPTRRANSLSRKECSRLAASTRKILQTAVDNGGSSIHDYQQPDGRLGYFQYLHRVYDKTGCTCPDCPFAGQKNGGIRKIVQDGRSTYYCPVKQK